LTGHALIISLMLIYVLAILAYSCSKRLKRFANSLSPLINFLSLVAVLALLAQFYLSIHQFESQRQLEEDRQTQESLARFKSLEKELEMNHLVAQWILSKKEEIHQTKAIPQNEFHQAMLDEILRSGEVQDPQLTFALLDVHHHILLANSRMHQLGLVRIGQALQPEHPDIKRMSEKRIKEFVGQLLTHAADIDQRIQTILPLLSGLIQQHERE